MKQDKKRRSDLWVVQYLPAVKLHPTDSDVIWSCTTRAEAKNRREELNQCGDVAVFIPFDLWLKQRFKEIVICEQCSETVDVVHTLSNADNPDTDYLLVCDQCLKNIASWAPQTEWREIINVDDTVIWTRDTTPLFQPLGLFAMQTAIDGLLLSMSFLKSTQDPKFAKLYADWRTTKSPLPLPLPWKVSADGTEIVTKDNVFVASVTGEVETPHNLDTANFIVNCCNHYGLMLELLQKKNAQVTALEKELGSALERLP